MCYTHWQHILFNLYNLCRICLLLLLVPEVFLGLLFAHILVVLSLHSCIGCLLGNGFVEALLHILSTVGIGNVGLACHIAIAYSTLQVVCLNEAHCHLPVSSTSERGVEFNSLFDILLALCETTAGNKSLSNLDAYSATCGIISCKFQRLVVV